MCDSSAPSACACACQEAPKGDINVEHFVRVNYRPFLEAPTFLAEATERTKALWAEALELLKRELANGGVLSVDAKTPSSIVSHGPGYLDKEKEIILGFQTDEPLKRAIKPLGGWRVVKGALEAYGYQLDPAIKEIFTKYRKTHNDGVFDIYNDEMMRCRRNHLLTGLPDNYGRGRIIGDYRRVALYGVDALIEAKKADKQALGPEMTEEVMRLREEVAEQIRALMEFKVMASKYGFDVSKPAANAREATQWLYFGYLAAVKEQDGAAMSMGRVDCFLDVFFERDLASGLLTESQAQEIIDDFVIKLRLIRHLRPPAYNELFAGDPTWVTCSVGGIGKDRRPLVSKTTYRLLHTLKNLGPAPEPNLTVLWSAFLPEPFKAFCAELSILTSSIQYENDDMMGKLYGDDYGIACCVSGMKLGKQMQFFGARCNLPKLLLYLMNEGRDEMTGEQVGPKFPKVAEGPLKYEVILPEFYRAMDWLAGVYVNTMNCIHFSHDKYNYERVQMALHDTHVQRLLAFGISGLSVIVDSLSAIKYAKVTPIRDERGITKEFSIEGDYPKFGNDDDRVDSMAREIVTSFLQKLESHPSYRNAKHTVSVLTITSNVVYGKQTGSTPDGRCSGLPFAPGANPMHGRDVSGALASLNSVAKIPYLTCLDGISNTFTIVPHALGKGVDSQRDNLVSLLSGYFAKNAHHLNVNVLNRDTLRDAMEHPEMYPQLTIRVSGYAVHFARLTRAQQEEVIARTFHESIFSGNEGC